MIRQRQPAYRLVYKLDEIIAIIQTLDPTVVTNKYYIINRLYFVRYSLRSRRRPRYIVPALNEIIQTLSYIA